MDSLVFPGLSVKEFQTARGSWNSFVERSEEMVVLPCLCRAVRAEARVQNSCTRRPMPGKLCHRVPWTTSGRDISIATYWTLLMKAMLGVKNAKRFAPGHLFLTMFYLVCPLLEMRRFASRQGWLMKEGILGSTWRNRGQWMKVGPKTWHCWNNPTG